MSSALGRSGAPGTVALGSGTVPGNPSSPSGDFSPGRPPWRCGNPTIAASSALMSSIACASALSWKRLSSPGGSTIDGPPTPTLAAGDVVTAGCTIFGGSGCGEPSVAGRPFRPLRRTASCFFICSFCFVRSTLLSKLSVSFVLAVFFFFLPVSAVESRTPSGAILRPTLRERFVMSGRANAPPLTLGLTLMLLGPAQAAQPRMTDAPVTRPSIQNELRCRTVMSPSLRANARTGGPTHWSLGGQTGFTGM